MTAAFVQPNDLAVERLLKKAAELLRDQDKNPALNGYSSGSAHAWEIASAIWAAVASLKLDYALPQLVSSSSARKYAVQATFSRVAWRRASTCHCCSVQR